MLQMLEDHLSEKALIPALRFVAENHPQRLTKSSFNQAKQADHIMAVHSKLRSASMHLNGCSYLVGWAHDAASCQGMPVPGGHLTGL